MLFTLLDASLEVSHALWWATSLSTILLLIPLLQDETELEDQQIVASRPNQYRPKLDVKGSSFSPSLLHLIMSASRMCYSCFPLDSCS